MQERLGLLSFLIFILPKARGQQIVRAVHYHTLGVSTVKPSAVSSDQWIQQASNFTLFYKVVATVMKVAPTALFLFSRFRSVYEPLQYLLTRESDVKTMRFIATDRHLLEYGRELQKVYDLSKMAASMDLFIPMELFVLDCTKIKEVKSQ